ncbi:MAG: ISAs1 family transposase [Ruminococcus sp.]|nr:ISAs1 family transposase [Ruminococcus sp.]
MAEIFVCIIMGLLAGKTKLRRIVRWSKRNLAELQRHLPFPNGVPSVSTMSRMLAAVDEEMVALALTNWIGEIYNTRGIHIAIDGKGLRAAARKVRDEKTPYILNAIDVASKLVIGQLVIQGKTNEMTAIPELMELLEIKGSTITIDAIGATGNILNAIHDNGGGGCPSGEEELPGTICRINEAV